MSFFDFGNTAENNGTFETSSGDIKPIPKGTIVKAIAEEAKWFGGEYGPEFVSIKWQVTEGEYKNRKIFQKIHTQSDDPNKSKKAQMMLGAINHNANGGLEKLAHKPTDAELNNALTFKPMMLKLEVWEIKEDRDTGAKLPQEEWKYGNWVSMVSPVGSVKPTQATRAAEAQNTAVVADPDSDLPF